MLTPAQLMKLAEIMERTHIVFIGSQLGSDVLTPKDIEILKKNGIDVSLLPKLGKADIAFRFGLLADSLGANAKVLSFEQIKKLVESEQYLPMSQQQKFALQVVKNRAYSDIKGLENRIVRDINTITVESSNKRRAKYEQTIKKMATNAVTKNSTVSELASEIGHKTKDWSRDLDRISDYVLHEAFDSGKAMAVLQKKGERGRVYKEVYAGACVNCQKLYLTAGIGSKPIVFTVGELISNGSNIGRKTKEWKPVIGPTHPWCRCELIDLPDNYEWSDDQKRFVLTRRETTVKRKSKVKITIEE